MAHGASPKRLVSGFVDYVGLACLRSVPGTTRVELRVGVVVANRDLQAMAPFLESMAIAVDGVLFEAIAYTAEPAEGMDNKTGVTWTFKGSAFDVMEDTTFQAPFENRLVNVELVDERLVDIVFKGARYNGKPTPVDMYGAHGGASGRVSDFMGYGTLRPSPTGEEHRWRITVTFSEWPRTPAWRLHDTLFINGVSSTVVECVSPTECDVVVPPRLATTSTLATVTSTDLPSHVNIEITSIQHAMSMARLFETSEKRDEYFMRLAMLEGDRGRTRSGPNPWSGAVVVDDASLLVLGTASCNSVDGTHPEMAAIMHSRHAWPERFVIRTHARPTTTGRSDASTSSLSGDSDDDDDDDDEDDSSSDSEAHTATLDNCYGMTLYVTHTPCVHRTDSHGASVDGCVSLLSAYKYQLRRLVIGVHRPGEEGKEALEALKTALPYTEVNIMDTDSELYAELRWTLREYLHWQDTKKPYVTALRVCDMRGQDVPRAAYHKDLDQFIDALRVLAQAVITDGQTLVSNPDLFKGLAPHEAIQLHITVPKARPAHSKHKDKPARHRVIKQPFPLRVLMTDAATLKLEPAVRKAALDKTDELGMAMIYTTADFIPEDAVAHRALFPDDAIFIQAPNLQAIASMMTTLWPIHPNIQIIPGESRSDPLQPRYSNIFNDLGARGVVTALVEAQTPLIERLIELGLVREMVTVTLPIMSAVPAATSMPVASSSDGTRFGHVMSLIACGQIGKSDVSFTHYMVTPIALKNEK